MKPTKDLHLWNRIEGFSIDDPSAGIKFSGKLAGQNGWTAAFTTKAIAEYKKFIFLSCISSTGASPSKIVDEVWHLHLTYTHNYWKEFCDAVLQRELHHHPSKGGAAEDAKHRAWYAETFAFYKDVFEEEPPGDIWPLPEPVATVSAPMRNLPEPPYTVAYKKFGYVLLLLPFLFPLFCGKPHPFALKGPQFLWFYGLLLAVTIVYFILVRNEKRRAMQTILERLDMTNAGPFQKARFVFGRQKAIQTAVVDLVAKGILIAEPRQKFCFYPVKVDSFTQKENPLAANLLRHHSGSHPLLMKDLQSHYDDSLTGHEGLAMLYKTVRKKDGFRFVVCSVVLLLGFVRVGQGLHNGYPVAYLQFMMMAGVFVFVVALTELSSKKLLQSIFTARYKAGASASSGTDGLLEKFVFLGTAAFAGSYAFGNLEATFRSNRASFGDGGGSSGCGSSCGSSCGGGCGGGCGGCGGGD